MAETEELNMHYVCTFDEAVEHIRDATEFWVADCGCRTGGDGCKKSRTDICTTFYEPTGEEGSSNGRKTTREEIDALVKEVREQKLVARPFRNKDRTRTVGFCWCCDCCCGYFKEDEYTCDKGRFIEETALDDCTHCGACADVCYFGARTMVDGELKLDRDKCFGCGLCVDSCAVECIRMVEREA